jgi:hypothetical protein
MAARLGQLGFDVAIENARALGEPLPIDAFDGVIVGASIMRGAINPPSSVSFARNSRA